MFEVKARVSSVGQSLEVQHEKLCDCDKMLEEKRSGTIDARPINAASLPDCGDLTRKRGRSCRS